MRDHAATEDMLRDGVLAWTALRNGFYAASGIALLGEGLKTGVVDAPEDGKVSWTAHADLAEAAAIVLADEKRYDGPTPPLTGPEALDLADLAAIASDLLDRTVARRQITDEDLQAMLSARAVPPPAATIALGLYRASRAAEFAAVNPTLERLLGRRPKSMRSLIAQTLAR